MKQHCLKTKDNTKIAINRYQNSFDEVVIIAPGWCMTKDSNAFKNIAETFNSNFDVISFDFRGHGKSKGFYTFGAKELFDLDCVINFAKENYKKIYLIGFSLGAFISAIYASQNDSIHKLILVSVPSDFNKIENQMYKKEAWLETFKKFELSRFLSIRASIIPHKKIKPVDIIDKIKTPTLFIAGKKDPTVHFWHTQTLFQKAKCNKKFKLYDNGIHAEDLFLHFQDDFSNLCFDWIKN